MEEVKVDVLVNKVDNCLMDIILSKGSESYILDGVMLWDNDIEDKELLFDEVREEVKMGVGEWKVFS